MAASDLASPRRLGPPGYSPQRALRPLGGLRLPAGAVAEWGGGGVVHAGSFAAPRRGLCDVFPGLTLFPNEAPETRAGRCRNEAKCQSCKFQGATALGLAVEALHARKLGMPPCTAVH